MSLSLRRNENSLVTKEEMRMITLCFIIMMFCVFGGLIGLAIRAAWGITKIVCSIILLPVALIVLVCVGLMKLAFPILVIVGICALLSSKGRV